jgi:leader peptidase (prepilin peptidase) / N-methyltransferase
VIVWSTLALAAMIGPLAALSGVIIPSIRYGQAGEILEFPSILKLTRLILRHSITLWVVAGLVAGAIVLTGSRFGATPKTAVIGVFLGLLGCLAMIDMRSRILPNALTLPGLWGGLLIQLHPASATVGANEAIQGAAIGYLLPWTVGIAFAMAGRRGSIGGGDLKLMAMVGAWLGPVPAIIVLFLASLGSSAFFGTGRLLRIGRPRRHYPFGPWLAVAAGAVTLAGSL